MSESNKEYPYIGKDRFNQVVLFIGNHKGVVIESNSVFNRKVFNY